MRTLILPLLLCTTVAASAGEPPRDDAFYDKCLATGRTTAACDAAMRVAARERERIRTELTRQWCTDQNPFAMLACRDDVKARLDSMSFDIQ